MPDSAPPPAVHPTSFGHDPLERPKSSSSSCCCSTRLLLQWRRQFELFVHSANDDVIAVQGGVGGEQVRSGCAAVRRVPGSLVREVVGSAVREVGGPAVW